MKVCIETFNPALQVCIENFSQTCNPPLKVWLSGQQTKNIEKTCFLTKIVFIFLKTMFACFKNEFFISKNVVFLKKLVSCMLLVEKSKNNIGIYCWDHFKRSNPKYGLLFFVSVFIKKTTSGCLLCKLFWHVTPTMSKCVLKSNPKHGLVVMHWFWFPMQ